ncbi:MAG: DKNYY domain-containing protein [Flavobacteriaceae bacterium]|nr:DKNYY domain-containing protein [Flavobacteriaceae bacterium]
MKKVPKRLNVLMMIAYTLKTPNQYLFKDSLDILYLRLKNKSLLEDSEKSKCQKLPHVYINQLEYQKEVVLISKILEQDSFERMDTSANKFYRDNNYIYVFQENPPSYPPLKCLDLNPKESIIFDNDYIKDKNNVYYNGIFLSKRAMSFKLVSNNGNLNIYADGKKMFWNWSELTYQDFKEIDFSVSKDSLKRIYFPK